MLAKSTPQPTETLGSGARRVRISYRRALVAALAAFAASTAWYIAFAAQLTQLGSAAGGSELAPPGAMLFVIAEHFVLAVVLSFVTQKMGVRRWTQAALLGVAAWLAFPSLVLTSSVVWEDVPWQLAAIHAGDWLLKLVVIAVIVVTRRDPAP